jgi:uncharacterized glyoxalase superfamily protein PhnB
MMLTNRCIPRATVIPVLAYPDVAQAVEWLCGAFGFTLRLGIGDHRAQLNVGGDGALVVREGGSVSNGGGHSVMIRVADVDAHCARAREYGAEVTQPPADHPYGERQYSVRDFAGNAWTFSQSIADVDPREWGWTAGEL